MQATNQPSKDHNKVRIMDYLIAIAGLIAFFIIQFVTSIPLMLWHKRSINKEADRMATQYSAKLGRMIDLHDPEIDNDAEVIKAVRDATEERMTSEIFGNRIANLAGYLATTFSWFVVICSYAAAFYAAYLYTTVDGQYIFFGLVAVGAMIAGSLIHLVFGFFIYLLTGRLPGQPAKAMKLVDEMDQRLVKLQTNQQTDFR